jgi:transposase
MININLCVAASKFGHAAIFDLAPIRRAGRVPVVSQSVTQTDGDAPAMASRCSTAMFRLLVNLIGLGIETAFMLVQKVFSHNLRARRAVARYAGLTGASDESGSKRHEKGLAKTGNARVRRGMVQLAWRFLWFQKDSALAQWFRTRTEGASGARKTKMIAALARKLLIALWRMVRTGKVPHGKVLRQAA